MNSSEVILRCMDTNVAYMATTSAGQVGYPAVVRLYQRIARQSLDCAAAWVVEDAYQREHLHPSGNPCPSHEPATEAFWWGVAAWTSDLTRDILLWHRRNPSLKFGSVTGVELEQRTALQELQEVFCRPHREFAGRLRPLTHSELVKWADHWNPRIAEDGWGPGSIILRHDAEWTGRVIYQTARWGLLHHIKDIPALGQSLLLIRRLKRNPFLDPVARAYLESDLVFLKNLFGNFTFTPLTQGILDRFLEEAGKELVDVC